MARRKDGVDEKYRDRYSETVTVSSLRLAAGWGAEDPLVEPVGGCPAGFTLPPIANAAAA